MVCSVLAVCSTGQLLPAPTGPLWAKRRAGCKYPTEVLLVARGPLVALVPSGNRLLTGCLLCCLSVSSRRLTGHFSASTIRALAALLADSDRYALQRSVHSG